LSVLELEITFEIIRLSFASKSSTQVQQRRLFLLLLLMSQIIFLELRQESLLLSLLFLESKQDLRQLSLLSIQFRFNNSFNSSRSSMQINQLRFSRNQLK